MAHLTAAPVAASSYCAVQTKRRKTTACYKCRQQVPLINLSNRTNHRLRAVGKEQEEEPQLDSRPIVRASQDTQDEEDLGVRYTLFWQKSVYSLNKQKQQTDKRQLLLLLQNGTRSLELLQNRHISYTTISLSILADMFVLFYGRL